MPEITVQYERKFSDGNFGSEGLSMSMSFSREPGAFDSNELLRLATALRKAVLEQLSSSEAERVRIMAKRELNPPRQPVPAGAREDDDEQPF